MARSPEYTVYCPLTDFLWSGEDFGKFPGLAIKRNHQNFDLRGTDEGLSEDQKSELICAGHWLIFQSGCMPKLSAAEVVNLFLLSLWLARPTKTSVQFRFEVNQDESGNHNGFTRIVYDCFKWNRETVADELAQEDLEKAAVYFDEFSKIRRAEKRLYHAIFFTYSACVAYNWSVALICLACATEALLTYEKGPGVTKRLAKSFACLTENTKSDRDRAYCELYELYSVRSDIMHGRLYLSRGPDKLAILSRFETALRKLWHAILPSHVSILEEEDCRRKEFFEGLQGDYQPPQCRH